MSTHGTPQASSSNQQSVQTLLVNFRQFIADGELEAAYRTACRAVEQLPDLPYVWVTRAIAERMLGRPVEAMESIRQSLQTRETPEALFELVQIAFSVGNDDEARKIALQLKARYPKWVLQAGAVFGDAGPARDSNTGSAPGSVEGSPRPRHPETGRIRPEGEGTQTAVSADPRVVMIGSLNTAFVSPLAAELKAAHPIQFHALGLKNAGGRPLAESETAPFEQVFRTNAFLRDPSVLHQLAASFNFDLYHFHYCVPVVARGALHLPRDARVLLSFWGSDLYRVAGVEEYRLQLAAIERADLVTVHSAEMAQTLLAKFGHQFASKVRYTLFGTKQEIYRAMDDMDRENARRAFTSRHDLDPERRIVVVGHNADFMNQHELLLQAIAGLDPAHRRQIEIVLPMTYKKDPSYIGRIRKLVKRLNLGVHILDDFMSEEDVAQLRVSSDILIHTPVSDALSGSMTETLYAENLVVTGSWLPYGRLRSRGVYHREIAEPAALTAVLKDVLDNYDAERERASGNRDRTASIVEWRSVTRGWLDVYAELLPGRVDSPSTVFEAEIPFSESTLTGA